MTDHKRDRGFSLHDFLSKNTYSSELRRQQDAERKAKIDYELGKVEKQLKKESDSVSIKDEMRNSMNCFNGAQKEQSELQLLAEKSLGSFLSGYVLSRGLKLGPDAILEIQAIAVANIPFISNCAQGFLASHAFSAFDVAGKEKSKSANRRFAFKVIEGGKTKKKTGTGSGSGSGSCSDGDKT